MTVSYSSEVFSSKGFGTFLKLLLKWKGSIYKVVWRELLVYMIIYSLLSMVYRLSLSEEGKLYFESVCIYCGNFGNQIPITFVLGFYVSLVIQRWWDQFENIPWPDSASLWVSTCIQGQDERGRLMRRTIVRYLNLGFILTLRLMCLPVKKRFPTLEHLVEAGILEEKEKEIIAEMQIKANQRSFWMPLVWAGSIVIRARKENRIKNDQTLEALITHISDFRTKCAKLLHYDWIPVPLVYTQVVTLAVYTYLLSTLFGRQFLDPSKKYAGHEVDLYIPIFSFLQFFFYMGWLKVAEALINPFGEDDDDFEMNWLIDRDLCVSYLIVDDMHLEHPNLVKDQFWDEHYPELPYTVASEENHTNANPELGSTAFIEVPIEKGYFIQDDLRMVVTEEDRKTLLGDDEIGSRSTLNGSVGKKNGSVPRKDSIMARMNSALGGSKSALGSTFSIFNKQTKQRQYTRRPSRMSQVRLSECEDHTEAAKHNDRNHGHDYNEMKKSQTHSDYDDIRSMDSNHTHPNEVPSYPNLQAHRDGTFDPPSPSTRRRSRRLSDPEKNLPEKKGLMMPRVNTHPKYLTQKLDMLQSFTEEALNVLKQEIESSKHEVSRHDSNANVADLFKALDETHQQFRNKLIKSLYQTKRQVSNRDESTCEDSPEIPETPSDVKKFLFKLDDLSGSAASLDQKDDNQIVGLAKSTGNISELPGSPLPDLHHELEIIEEQNEADNQSDNGSKEELAQQ